MKFLNCANAWLQNLKAIAKNKNNYFSNNNNDILIATKDNFNQFYKYKDIKPTGECATVPCCAVSCNVVIYVCMCI